MSLRFLRRIASPLFAGAVLLAACQGPPPPAPEPGKTSRVGNTTIITSGRVSVEGAYVD